MESINTLNNTNCSRSQYLQAIKDPTLLSEDDLLELLLKYPYSQPLIFAYERRKKLLKQESHNKELALLYAPSESWLMLYVNKPIQNVNDSLVLDDSIQQNSLSEDQIDEASVSSLDIDDSIGIEDSLGDSIESNIHSTDEADEIVTCDSEESDSETVSTPEIFVYDSDKLPIEEDLTLEKLVHEGSVMGDYLSFNDFENRIATEDNLSQEVIPSDYQDDKENISLYNDDLMPYSFRWWLHKTRLEYADTYQPYAVTNVTLPQSKPTLDTGKIEESILDQQIKENIIHFQDPEEKLSEEVKKKPFIPVPPKKGADIIEKFIQQDPIIHPPSPENINNENMARQSAEDNYLLVTETLANIYLDQGLYLKAIEVFKKLILKYPEKKSYFATRIEELEKNL